MSLALLAAAAVTPVQLTCDVMLMTAPGRFTAPSPVTISFSAEGKDVRDIRVVDAGGILFPGANLKLVQTPGVSRMESIPISPERPGRWTGTAEKTIYRLRLVGGTPAEWAEIGIGRKPVGPAGRFGLVWNASHQPEGLPQPITGSGGGPCTPKDSQ